MAMTFKDEELKALLAEVSADLEKAMTREVNQLRKDFPPDKEPGSSTPPPADNSAPEGSAGSADASPAPADGSAGPSAAVSPEMSGGPGGDPAQDAAVDPEALKQEYLKLGPEGLKVHMMAIQAAAMELTGGGDPAGQPAPTSAPAPMAPSPSPAPAPAPGGAPVIKDERLMSVQPKGKITNGPDRLEAIAVHKSEEDFKSLNDKVDLLSKALHEIVGKPIRKAVTEIPYNGKPQTEVNAESKSLTKSEITAKLNTVSRNPSLAKSDRQRINSFYDGTITVDGIKDLLK